MASRYRNLFFDLDDTLWAFSENARDTFEAMYEKHRYGRYFDSFEHFYTLYTQRNLQLWEEYGRGLITKDELNRQRFFYPLQQVGVEDAGLAQDFSRDFFAVIPTCRKLMPLSDDIGILKPHIEIFHFAMSATQSELQESLMIGDNWENDIVGARNAGMHQVYYHPTADTSLPFHPTYHISDLQELTTFL